MFGNIENKFFCFSYLFLKHPSIYGTEKVMNIHGIEKPGVVCKVNYDV